MTPKKKKKRKYRLRYEFKKFLVYFFVFLGFAIWIIKESIVIYKDFKYQDTYEYKLEQLGYSKAETKKLIETLSEDKLDILLKEEYNEHYYNIIKQKYYIPANYEQYIEYKNKNDKTSYEDVIAIVNVKANLGWYKKIYSSNINDDYKILVNKFYFLEEDYERDDLIPVNLSYSYANNKAVPIVIENFEKMHDDLKNELNVDLMINVSFRSFENQGQIYENCKKISLKYADINAVRPGHSEHQTGLALDLTSLQHRKIDEFIKSEEFEWLKKNSYKYGFILRYPDNKDYITGISNEKNHFRYVGNDIAKKIYEENITFDEYYAYYIAN